VNIKIEAHDTNFESRRHLLNQWKAPEQIKKDMSIFFDDLALGKVNKGKRIADATRLKYLYLLRTPLEFINKPIQKIIKTDIENFERAVSSGNLKSSKGKPFAHSVMVDIRIALKIFLRWKLGREKADALTDWLDIRDQKKTPDYLKESEIIKLFKSCKSTHERYLIAMLFDSGARAEEFLNIRMEDLELPEGNQQYVKLTLKDEYSKTAGRVISLYWKFSLEAVQDYLYERRAIGIKSTEPIYEGSYDSLRFFLARLGNKILGKKIHPHLFRHTSATYYASQMNRQQLCLRYGWKFSSTMPDVYIARSGVDTKELDEKFSNTTITLLQSELEKTKKNTALEMQELKENVKALCDYINELKLKGNPQNISKEILKKIGAVE